MIVETDRSPNQLSSQPISAGLAGNRWADDGLHTYGDVMLTISILISPFYSHIGYDSRGRLADPLPSQSNPRGFSGDLRILVSYPKSDLPTESESWRNSTLADAGSKSGIQHKDLKLTITNLISPQGMIAKKDLLFN